MVLKYYETSNLVVLTYYKTFVVNGGGGGHTVEKSRFLMCAWCPTLEKGECTNSTYSLKESTCVCVCFSLSLSLSLCIAIGRRHSPMEAFGPDDISMWCGEPSLLSTLCYPPSKRMWTATHLLLLQTVAHKPRGVSSGSTPAREPPRVNYA